MDDEIQRQGREARQVGRLEQRGTCRRQSTDDQPAAPLSAHERQAGQDHADGGQQRQLLGCAAIDIDQGQARADDGEPESHGGARPREANPSRQRQDQHTQQECVQIVERLEEQSAATRLQVRAAQPG